MDAKVSALRKALDARVMLCDARLSTQDQADVFGWC